MAGWFDPMKQDFNVAEDDLSRRKKMIADLLAQAQSPMNAGEMVSGHYVPQWGAALGKGLQAYLANKQGDELKDEQQKLSADQFAAQKAALANALNLNPTDVGQAPQDQYTYKDPNAVGPTMDQLNGVQTMPVPDRNVQPNPMPPVAPAAKQALAAAMPAPQPTPQQIEQMTRVQAQNSLPPGDPDLSKPYIGYRSAGPRTMGPPQPAPQAPMAAPQAMPQAMPQPQPQATVQPPASVLPQANPQPAAPMGNTTPDEDFNIQRVSPAEQQAYQASVLREALKGKQRDKLDGILALGRTGETGKVLSQALLGKMLTPGEVKLASNGDGTHVAYDPRQLVPGQTIGSAKPDTASATLSEKQRSNTLDEKKFVADTQKKLQEARQNYGNHAAGVQVADSLIEDVGKANPMGGVLSSLRDATGRALGEDSRNAIKGKLQSLTAQLQRAINGPGVLTDGDRAFAQQVIGDLSQGKVPAQEAIMRARAMLVTGRDSFQNEVQGYEESIAPYTSQKATASGDDWKKKWPKR